MSSSQMIQSMPKDQDLESAGNGNDELKEGFIIELKDGSIFLDFSKYVGVTNDSFVEKMFKHDKIKNKQVIALYLNDWNITDATAETIANSEICRNMEYIDLRVIYNLTDKGITTIINSNPELKHFNIGRCTKLTDSSMEAVVEGCPNLEELHAKGVGLTSLPDDMFDKLPNLKMIDLRNNELTKLPTSIANVNNCRILVDGNPGLRNSVEAKEQLDRINNSISSEAMENMIINDNEAVKEDWVSLNFWKYPDKTNDNFVQEILDSDKIKNKHVRSINMHGCSNITDTAANSIANSIANSEHCTNMIEEIYISDCDNLTDTGITTIVNSNPQLKRISFERCTKLTDFSVEAVVEGCRNLEELNAEGVGLTSLPDDMFVKLPNLIALSLENNKLTKLPESITHLSEECFLQFSGNPLQDPPLAVALRDGLKGIWRYREDVKNGSETSNTLKTVFVGDGEAGKTTLLNLIRGDEKPRTKEEERTIHLDLVDIPINLEGDRTLNLACYDCGGQKQYAVGQTAFLTSSALYFLCINAEEPDMTKFVRFLVMLQARAPGAVVQVVLTKIDRVDKPEVKRAEVQKEIKRFRKSCESFESSVGGRERGHLLLRIQDEIIMTSIATPRTIVFKNIKNRIFGRQLLIPTTRDDLIKVITDLTTERPPLFPTLGQKIPTSWLTCRDFLYTIRDIGCEDKDEHKKALFKAVEEGREGTPSLDDESVENSIVSDSPKDAFIVCKFYLAISSFIAAILRAVLSWIPRGIQENDRYRHSIENLKKDHDIATFKCPCANRESVTKLWEEYCHRRATANPPPKATHLQDMITVLEAEGAIFSSDDLLVLHPPYITALMRPLINHSLDLKTIASDKFLREQLTDFVAKLQKHEKKDETGTASLEKSLEHFVRSGKIDGKTDGANLLLRYLWLHLEELKLEDYAKVFDMFREQGIVIDSTFNGSEQDASSPIDKHPIFIFRLSERPADFVTKWQKKCPENTNYFELRIQLQAGCPDSLAVTFAAKCHAFGNCLQAWKHEATVATKKNIHWIHAELIRTSKHDYILFAVRTVKSQELDEYSKFLFSLAFQFMKEQEKYLPGLLYNILWTCPKCIEKSRQDHEITTFPWYRDEKHAGNVDQPCDKCDESVDLITMKMAVSPEDAMSIYYEKGEEGAQEMFRMLKYLVTAVENIPRLVLDIKNIQCPYLFKFISQSDYDGLCTYSPSPSKSSNTEIPLSDRLDEAEKVMDKVQNGIYWLEAPTEEKKKGFKKLFRKKIENKKTQIFYLQLLDGESFLPVVTYKIKEVNYSDREKKYAQVAADMCTVGIKASIVWNTAGKIASAFGVPVIQIPKKQLEGIQTLLKEVTAVDDKRSKLMKKENKGLKSGVDLDEFEAYLKELDQNNQMCKPVDEAKDTKKTWENFLRRKVTKDKDGIDRIIWVDSRKDLR